MKILAFKKNVPWPTWSGKDLRTFNVLKSFQKRHEVVLACWAGRTEDLKHMPFETILRPMNGKAAERRSRGFEHKLYRHYGIPEVSATWLQDLIVEHDPDVLFGINYQTLLALDQHTDLKKICYLGDNRWSINLQSYQQRHGTWWSNFKELAWSYRFHRRFANAADGFIFVAEEDALAMRRFTTKHCWGVPNGVDTDYFKPTEDRRDPNAVVFVGSLNFPPNIQSVMWFCQTVWPVIKAQNPRAKLTLVGKKPAPAVVAFQGQWDIEVLGDVPDIRPYLSRATVDVVPMKSGGGIKNKILEGWAMGIPVVATSMSLPGLQAIPGKNILTADDPQAFAEQVLGLMHEQSRVEGLGREGRATVLAHHSWDLTARLIEGCFEQLREPQMELV